MFLLNCCLKNTNIIDTSYVSLSKESIFEPSEERVSNLQIHVIDAIDLFLEEEKKQEVVFEGIVLETKEEIMQQTEEFLAETKEILEQTEETKKFLEETKEEILEEPKKFLEETKKFLEQTEEILEEPKKTEEIFETK